MSAFSRRFANTTCIGLNNGAFALFAGETLSETGDAVYPTRDGRVRRVKVK